MATALRLPDLPREPLARILALACDTPEQLFAAGAACASLRAAAGCTDASLAPLWNRVMALVDPAGALARPSGFVMRDSEACCELAAGYAVHARRLGGSWHALAHALAARTCAVCGGVTRCVARCDARRLGPVRCCHGCADALLLAAAAARGEAAPEDAAAAPLTFCVVLNAFLFEGGPVAATLDADELGAPAAAAAALQAAVEAASDGDTILLRGAFTFAADDRALLACGGAARLLGAPARAPYHADHRNFHPHAPRSAEELLLHQRERAAAAALGFPSASLHFATRGIIAMGIAGDGHGLWASHLRISSGDRTLGALHPRAQSSDAALQEDDDDACAAVLVHVSSALVLQRCWLTGYTGCGVLACEDSCLALLRCCVSNSSNCAVLCAGSTTLCLRGCHVISNCKTVTLRCSKHPAERERALQAANVFANLPNRDEQSNDDDAAPPADEDVLLLT
jgi:hypothetical protein